MRERARVPKKHAQEKEGANPSPESSARVAVSKPTEPLEIEAARVADQVMRAPERATDRGHDELKPASEASAPAGMRQTLTSDAGRPLDSDARAFLEPRFGHDFRNVRVHTDDRAAASAQAFGARAFTVDRHIVFGREAYSPGTTHGRELLAHELTHVIQQSGGATGGLGISAAPATAGAAVMRSPAGDMATLADQAADEEKKQLKEKPPLIDKIDNIGDVSYAATTRKDIVSYRTAMQKGKSDGDEFITEAQVNDNENAITVLDQYIGDARMQGSTLGDFQGQFDKLAVDYVRLLAEVRMYGETKQGKGTDDAADNVDVAKAQIASTGKDTRHLQADFRKATTSNAGSGNTAQHQEGAQRWLSDMHKESQAVARTQGDMVVAQHKATASAENVIAVLGKKKADSLQGKIDELKQKAADAKENVALIGKFVKSAVSMGTAAMTGGIEAGDAVKEGSELAMSVAEYFASKSYDDDIKTIKRELNVVKAEVDHAEVNSALEAAAADKERYVLQCQAFVDANRNLDNAKKEYRRSMREMGASADTATGAKSGTRFEVIASLLSEAEGYLSQSDATIAIGERELKIGEDAHKSKAAIQNKEKDKEPGAITYWRPYSWYTRQTLSYQATKMQFKISLTGEGETHPGSSAEGEQYGINPVMGRAMVELKQQHKEIEKYANVLRQVFQTTAPTTPAK